MLPPVYNIWVDNQIRRHFGPMGIDCLADLALAPLARRGLSRQHEVAIAVLGNGCLPLAILLAESFVKSTDVPFKLHIHDAAGPSDLGDAGLATDHPLREFLEILPPLDSAESLRQLLAAREPRLLISRNFPMTTLNLVNWDSEGTGNDVWEKREIQALAEVDDRDDFTLDYAFV